MLASVPIQTVLFTVFQSIFQVFLLCLAGFTLSCKGIVDKPSSKVLNHINIALFTPALLFSKVAFFLTPAKLRQLWVIPILFIVVTLLSAVIAYWLGRAFRLKRSQVIFATAASMFMNSNSLPVALMQSLAMTAPVLKWGPDDTIDAMFGRSLTYLVVFSTLGMMLRWSYGVRLIAQADEPEPISPPPTTYHDVEDSDDQPVLKHVKVGRPATARLIDYEADLEPHDRTTWRVRLLRSRHSHPRLTPVSWRHAHSHAHRHSHLPAVPTSLGDQSESDASDEVDSEDTIALRSETIDTGFSTEAEDPAPAPLPSSPSDSSVHPTPRWCHRAVMYPLLPIRWFLSTLASLSPPLIASLLALLSVMIPPVQQALKSEDMIPFREALDNAGACSIPITMIVLGGWFWDGEAKPRVKRKEAEEVEGKRGSDGHGNAKSKGKAVEKRHGPKHGAVNGNHPTPFGKRLGHQTLTPKSDLSPLEYHVTPSRDSSTTSLSSMIGAVGDVLRGRTQPRGGPRKAKRCARGDAGPINGDVDVESGLLTTHPETEIEHAENEPRRSSRSGSRSRSRSQTRPVNGHAQPTPSPSSASTSTSQLVLPESPDDVQETSPPGETLTIFVTLLARMVIVPLVMTPLMVLVSRLGWGGEVFEDPVFIVSSMLLISSPPALTLAQISQRSGAASGKGPGGGADANAFSPFERLLSRTVFWAYCVVTPPVTIASVMVGLYLIEA